MAPGTQLLICLSLLTVVLSPPVSSCIPHSISARVPARVDRGVVVSQVPLGGCRRVGLTLTSSDPDFRVKDDGVIVADRATAVTSRRTFRVWASEAGGKGRGEGGRPPPPAAMDVHLRPVPSQQVGGPRPAQKAQWDHQSPQRPAQKAPWNQAPQRPTHKAPWNHQAPQPPAQRAPWDQQAPQRPAHKAPWEQAPPQPAQRVPWDQQAPQRPAHKAPWDKARKRSKRRWSPLPFNIIEHDPPPYPKAVELVGSDSAVNFSVYYTIKGPGVDLDPKNLFSVDRETGMLSVHYAVDREEYAEFVFDCQVFDSRTNIQTDLPLPITVLVMDINDNAPTFTGPLEFHIAEQSVAGTDVGVILAADKDLQKTLHTKIKFSLLSATQLFNIHAQLGRISTRTATLDREAQASIPVTVEIRDMDGATTGLFSTATATVHLVDINDNPPTFRQTAYKATVEENTSEVLVLRIPVDDRDQENTKNWKATFSISEGNAGGHFRIDSDAKTNEGLLYLVKPLDREKSPVVMLKVTAQNEVPLVGAAASGWVSVPVEVSVSDVDEGPEFLPPSLLIMVKENTPNGTLIGTYAARDPETRSTANMTYHKVLDPGSWVVVSPSSGELTVANVIDNESPLVFNNMYNISIMAVDNSNKSGVGMVTLLIEDVNDNVPGLVLPSTGDDGEEGALVVCEEDEEGRRGSVALHAVDADESPYSAPFHFQLGDGHDGRWTIVQTTNTSALLTQAVDMVRGYYVVPVRVSDLQGRGEVRDVPVRVCRCVGGECFSQQTSVALGVWGVLAMLLALLLLLLLCIFCVFACNTKDDKIYLEDSSGGMLLKSNTEAPGEEVKSTDLFLIPTAGGVADTVDGSVKGAGLPEEQKSVLSQQQQNATMTQQSMYQTSSSRNHFTSTQGMNGFYGSGVGLGGGLGGGGGGHYRGSAAYMDSLYHRQSYLSALHTWDTNGLYLDRKLDYFGGESEERFAADAVHPYGYEGEGSAAGSVGCCSELGGTMDDLGFLDDLGSKFKTLAHICMDSGEDEGDEV